MIISTGGNDFFKYPYAAILTRSEKLGARFKVSRVLFWVVALAEEQQPAKHLMKIQQDGVTSWRLREALRYHKLGQQEETQGPQRAALQKAQSLPRSRCRLQRAPTAEGHHGNKKGSWAVWRGRPALPAHRLKVSHQPQESLLSPFPLRNRGGQTKASSPPSHSWCLFGMLSKQI